MCRYSFAYSPYIPSINSVFFSPPAFSAPQARLEVPFRAASHLSGVLLMELSRRLQHLRGVLQRHHDDPIGICYDDVPRMDADAAAGDGDVDLSRSLLVGAAGVDPVAYTGRSISRRASTSRTGPSITSPPSFF